MPVNYETVFKFVVSGLFILISIGFGLVYLEIAPTATEPYWSRFIALLPIIEALLYASAGFIFGTEVHREEAIRNENHANTERNRAEAALRNGALLRESVMDFQRHLAPMAITAAVQPELDNLVADANTYFPR